MKSFLNELDEDIKVVICDNAANNVRNFSQKTFEGQLFSSLHHILKNFHSRVKKGDPLLHDQTQHYPKKSIEKLLKISPIEALQKISKLLNMNSSNQHIFHQDIIHEVFTTNGTEAVKVPQCTTLLQDYFWTLLQLASRITSKSLEPLTKRAVNFI